MTLVIIGAYRGVELVDRAVRSLERRMEGMSELVIVNDSPDPTVAAKLEAYGRVIDLGGEGYNVAMRTVCDASEGRRFMFWEEDFYLTARVDLAELHAHLEARPHLAQIALLRQPWFPIEREHGGLIQGLQARGGTVAMRGGIWETPSTFTCNPALWRAGIADLGWPQGDWSEDKMLAQVLKYGYAGIGFLDGQRVVHDGQRSGYGY